MLLRPPHARVHGLCQARGSGLIASVPSFFSSNALLEPRVNGPSLHGGDGATRRPSVAPAAPPSNLSISFTVASAVREPSAERAASRRCTARSGAAEGRAALMSRERWLPEDPRNSGTDCNHCTFRFTCKVADCPGEWDPAAGALMRTMSAQLRAPGGSHGVASLTLGCLVSALN